MSREIKFRAWDKDLAKYLGGCEIDSLMAELSAGDDGRAVIIKQICPARYVFEQYTGLIDKNGKEIYEGDIIQETTIIGGATDGTDRYEVYWDEDTLCWSIKGISDIDYHLRDDLWETNASREVIGNIHEPPKDFRPEHLKRMGVSISKGGEE